MFLIWILLIVNLKSSFAVIYRLKETEYHLMPALFALDDYDTCLREPGGVYCVLDAELRANNQSSLMRMIQEYSAHKIKHYNHTQIHRGVCVTRTCERYHTNGSTREILQRCLNHSIWSEYGLETTIADVRYCVSEEDDRISPDAADIVVAIVYIILILLNVTGSLYDVWKIKNFDKPGNQYILAFSLRRNWRRLTANNSKSDARLEPLAVLNGLRTMTLVCVIFSHTVLVMAYSYVDNPLYIEKSYEDPLKQILFNGNLVTHTFFVMSSFLVAYNVQILSERHEITLMHWLKGILLRWLRLTPTYALIVATIATWMRHLGSGPVWRLVVTSEAVACRRYWWAHLLYVNNYLYQDAHCAPQTWYLAADTQLFCAGLLLCVCMKLTRVGSAKMCAILAVLLAGSMLITAAHTYFQNLDAVVMQSPESYRNLYASDDTFRLRYIRGHTNLSSYVLGLSGGLFTYHLQKEQKDFTQYKKYRWLFWLLFPLGVAVILSGGLFYMDDFPVPVGWRVLYATLYKPIFQILIVALIVCSVFKLENIYRGIVSWRGFTWPARVSYSAFLLHTLFQRGLVGAQTTPAHITDYYVLCILTSTIFLTFMGASLLWLLVEAPAAALTRAVFMPKQRETTRQIVSKV